MLVFFTNLSLTEFQVRYLAFFLLLSVMHSFKWFWMGSLHKNIQLMLEFLKNSIESLHSWSYTFLFCTLMTFLMMLSVILLSMLIILLSILSVIRHLICGNDQSNNTGAIDVKMDGSVLEEKLSLKLLELTFSSKWDWGSYIITIVQTSSKTIGALICSMKFLSPEVALYLYKSTIRSCMEYCCQVWAGAPSCYLELLDKLQKWICRTVGPSLATSLEPLVHYQNVASLSLFYRYYFGRCSSKLAQLVHSLSIEGGALVILIDCMIFLSPFLDVTRMSMSTVSFLTQLDSEILCL